MTVRSSALKVISPLAVAFLRYRMRSPSEAQTDVRASQADWTAASVVVTTRTRTASTTGSATWTAQRILRVEVDNDEDGKVDRWDTTAPIRSSRSRTVQANDGKVDRWAYRAADGTLLKMEISRSATGRSSAPRRRERRACRCRGGYRQQWRRGQVGDLFRGTLTSVAFVRKERASDQGSCTPPKEPSESRARVEDRVHRALRLTREAI